MNKAQRKAKEDMETKRGYFNHHDPRWYWRVRGYSELIHYWSNAFQFPISILIWWFTDDFWKGLAYLAVSQVYNISQNLRGLFLHIEQWIEFNIKKTI